MNCHPAPKQVTAREIISDQSSEPKWMSRMTPSRGPTSEIGVMQVPPRGSINAIVAIPLLISMWQRRNDQASALHHFLNK
jgi:hypothetical protein